MTTVRGEHSATGAVALPGDTAALAAIARVLAAQAGPVLSSSGSTLLMLTLATAGAEHDPLDIGCWDGRRPVSAPWSPLPVGGAADDPGLAALQAAGRLLLVGLLPRWPANARPPSVGIVTDGHGVAFSPDHPSPARTGWLGWHLGGACATTTLLPFAPTSCWTRLIAPAGDDRPNGRLLFSYH